MIVLHRGFDYLALAIRANIPETLQAVLDAEKEVAEEERRSVLMTYNGLQFHLSPHGGGGYRFLLSGGPDGAQWSFKKPNAKDAWGIRVTFGSDFMAFHGLGAAKAHVEHVTERLGISYRPDDISISRIDFCTDILHPDFVLSPENFVMHSNAGRRDYITGDDLSVHGKSGRVTSVTVGKIKNRQVIIYDKREQVIASGKTQWWAIWNNTLRKLNDAETANVTLHRDNAIFTYPYIKELEPSDPTQSRVWRVEMRAGKDLLKDTWNIRTWSDLFDRFGDLCRQTGEVVRYTDPAPGDTNRARWPNHLLWEIAISEINDDLFEMRSGVDPNPLKEVHQEEHIAMLLRQVTGSSITLAALRQCKADGLAAALDRIAQDMKDQVRSDPLRAAKQLQDAKDRYVFKSHHEELA